MAEASLFNDGVIETRVARNVLVIDECFCSLDARELRRDERSGMRGSAVIDVEEATIGTKVVRVGEGRSVVCGAGTNDPEGITNETS